MKGSVKIRDLDYILSSKMTCRCPNHQRKHCKTTTELASTITGSAYTIGAQTKSLLTISLDNRSSIAVKLVLISVVVPSGETNAFFFNTFFKKVNNRIYQTDSTDQSSMLEVIGTKVKFVFDSDSINLMITGIPKHILKWSGKVEIQRIIF